MGFSVDHDADGVGFMLAGHEEVEPLWRGAFVGHVAATHAEFNPSAFAAHDGLIHDLVFFFHQEDVFSDFF